MRANCTSRRHPAHCGATAGRIPAIRLPVCGPSRDFCGWLMRHFIAALVLLVGVAGVAAAAPASQRVVLPNGLAVIAIHDDSSAIGAFHLAVRVNPASVPKSALGVIALSQQVAQLSLKDLLTQEPWVALGEDVRNTRAALTLNTELDYAEARCQLPAQSLPVALQVAGKAIFGTPDCTPQQAAAAKDILTNAIADGQDNVVENTYYHFLEAFFGKQSALAQPAEGTPETLGALAATDIVAYRNTFIGPNNASLCVIGPQSVSELVGFARAALGEYAPSKTTATREPAPPLPVESTISVAQLPRWRGASLMVGVGTPPYGTDGFLRAQLIYTLLEGEQGRLRQDKELRGGLGLNQLMNRGDDQPTVTLLAPMAMPRPLLVMHMMTVPRLMETARTVLLGHLLAFAKTAPAEAELSAGKQRLINAYAMMQLSRLNFAKSVNCYEIYGQDYSRVWKTGEDISAITGEELVTLAKECFQTHAVGVIMPGDDEGE